MTTTDQPELLYARSARVREPGNLEPYQGWDDARSKNRVGNEMIGELGSKPVDRQMIRILFRRDQSFSEFPNRIVAGQENNAAALQDRNVVAL